MKKINIALILSVLPFMAMACPECDRKQPKALQGIAHGAGPEQNWDYLIVGLTSLIVVVSLFYAVKWIIRPGEKNSGHIKREVLNFD